MLIDLLMGLLMLSIRILGTAVLLEAARAVWGDREDVRFHHVSTDEVLWRPWA